VLRGLLRRRGGKQARSPATLTSGKEQARLPAAPPPEGEEALAAGAPPAEGSQGHAPGALPAERKKVHLPATPPSEEDQRKLQERHLQRIEINWIDGGPVKAERLALVAHCYLLVIVFCLNISGVPEKLPRRCFLQFFNHHRCKPFIVTFIVFPRFQGTISNSTGSSNLLPNFNLVFLTLISNF